jgi:tetratricopeptide (TPR) repeat protein
MKHPAAYLTILTLIVSPLQSAPADPAALGRLSAASAKAEKAGDYPAAIARMTEFERVGGDPFYAALRLGWLQYNAGGFTTALRHYQKAAALKPAALNPRIGLLNTATALKDARLATRSAQAVLAIDPLNYQALMALAGLRFADKDYTAAATAYERVLTNFPDDSDALSGAAWSALRADDKTTALNRFDLLLGRNPDYPKAAEGRSRCQP